MPERRNLRSNRSDTTNGEKSQSNSQSSSSNKDRPPHTRTNSKGKGSPTKKTASAKDMSGDKHHMNGGPVENGVNGTEDVEMDDSSKGKKDHDGDEEMTVVVPPPKGQKPFGGAGQDKEEDVAMEGTEDARTDEQNAQAKAVTGVFPAIHSRKIPINHFQ